ncbi:glycosyltransferase family 4 protein [Microbacterium sp. IEGM 1404]|uniref:glycosyltransferase family 4 protein n=1 Tax=Microbacterium sp. IEGM 1404 TaxID=3047084 RepID=UPI0024B6990F|nr:glycosyltransferase family 1 protein [Microbacterium sp. IEGM 1404]MDI9892087.1 glycosyltransferase family 1 protein [Microbacterium sp. IEGM 1404]
MTRVLVDLLFFTGKQGGTETVARQVYSRLAERPGWEFVGYASSELVAAGAEWFPGRLIDSGLQCDKRPQWAWGEVFGVSRAARSVGADLIHSPANFGPPRPGVPLVLTLHDMLAFKRPEFLPSKAGVLPTKLLISGAARAASHIVTDSEAARADILEITGRDAADVTVVFPGGSGVRRDVDEQPRSGLFSLGNRMPHKNFPRLLEALALLPEASRPVLTISGSHGDDPLRAVAADLGIEKWVDLRGWLTQDEVENLYRTSAAVVFPTLFEGFGLPVLEGMERGCPVICSDIPVLREVGGDAVRYFDPLDPADIARQIERTLADPAARAAMVEDGRERAGLFTWDATAEGMLEAFGRVTR